MVARIDFYWRFIIFTEIKVKTASIVCVCGKMILLGSKLMVNGA